MPTKVELMQELMKVYSEIYDLKESCKRNTSNELYYRLSKIIENAKYPPDTIECVLNNKKEMGSSNNQKKRACNNIKNISPRILEIVTEEQVKKYYNEVLSAYYKPDFTEEEKAGLLKGITLADLMYLVSIITTVRIPKGKKKSELLYIIRRYVDSVSRTEAMK